MTMTEERSEAAVRVPARAIDMKLEIVVVPVSDVDRAKAFYTPIRASDGGSTPTLPRMTTTA